MHELFGFLLTVVLSFWGSLQLGLVNVTVIETTLAGGFRRAQPVAIGGAIPELIYAALAIFFVEQIQQYRSIIEAFSWAMIAVFALLGLYFLMKKQSKPELQPASTGFWKGFALGMINPQLILYWTFVFFYLQQELDLNTFTAKLLLVAGAMIGAWLALVFFAFLTEKYRHKLLGSWSLYMYRTIGIFFIGMSMWELWNKC